MTEHIVIVGGGSAGWMSASTLISQFPQKRITVIESPRVPIIGVGESTIGGINDWCNLIGIKDTDFMKYTDASYKLGIKFTNFYKKDSGSFYYPFGKTDTDGNISDRNEWYFKKMKYPDTPIGDYSDCLYPIMALIRQNKLFRNEDGALRLFKMNEDTAYHFDATSFGIWLRDTYCKPKGVVHIQADVIDVITNEEGIDHLVLDNGDHVKADLFIDCTGFKSILLAGAMKEPFVSYEHILPNNSAWATRIPYTNKREQLVSCTECEAIQNGWVWNIPLWSRIGSGYVYSDKFIRDEDALEEFKSFLKTKNMYSDDLEFKNLKMRIGIHKRLWVKNVCAIGLSAGFIEPLESSGLYTVHEFLVKLVRTLNRGNGPVSQWDKDAFSSSCIIQFSKFSEFVALHYALSHRDDTPYWVANLKKEYCRDLIDQVHTPFSRVPELSWFVHAIESRLRLFHYGFDNSGTHCIFTGMNYFPADRTSLTAYTHPPISDHDIELRGEHATQHLNMKKALWDEIVKNAPILVDFLKSIHQA